LCLLLTACGESLKQSAQPGEAPSPTARSLSSPGGVLPTPSAPQIKAPSITDNSLNLTVSGDVTYVGTANQGLFALRRSNGSLLWHTGLEGGIGELPVVDNQVVFVSSYSGQVGPGTLAALRADNGAILWKYRSNGYIFGPIVQNGVAYITIQYDGLLALRVSDGKPLWKFSNLNAQVPLLSNGVLYMFSSGDGFYALRASDGKLLWHTAETFNSSAFIIQSGVIYAFSENEAYALRASDGHLLWSNPLDSSFSQDPVLSNGVLYIFATKVLLEGFTPTPTVTPSPSPESRVPGQVMQPLSFQASLQKSVSGVPVRQTTYLKEGKSSVFALRASDGKLLWQDLLNQGKNSFVSSLYVASNSLYVALLSGTASSISELRKDDGSVIWQRTVNGSVMGTYLKDGRLYSCVDFQGRSAVYALNPLDGTLNWIYAIDGDTYFGLVPGSDALYIVSNNGIVYALRRANGTLIWHYQTEGGKNA
jgi:outer membrane protein assembly factor BamB